MHDKMGGTSLPIFVDVFYAYMHVFNRDRIQPGSWIGRLLFVMIIMLALTYALFSNPVLYVLNALAIRRGLRSIGLNIERGRSCRTILE